MRKRCQHSSMLGEVLSDPPPRAGKDLPQLRRVRGVHIIQISAKERCGLAPIDGSTCCVGMGGIWARQRGAGWIGSKRHTPEQTINKLRAPEVEMAKRVQRQQDEQRRRNPGSVSCSNGRLCPIKAM